MAIAESSLANFAGRKAELGKLHQILKEVAQTRSGRMVALRGRRQVGKSRLAEVFCEQAKVPYVFFQATRKRLPQLEINLFQQQSVSVISPVFIDASFNTWDGILAAVATSVTKPLILVVDELPWLIEGEPSVEGALQTAWDRHLQKKPVLLLLIGSDLAMMDALSDYGRPLYDRAQIMNVNPLNLAEVAQFLKTTPVEVLDTYTVTGGFPNLIRSRSQFETLHGFLRHHLKEATSPLIISGERTLAAEFPIDAHARTVLNAIGTGEKEYKTIASVSGVGGSSLERALELLLVKKIITKIKPYSAEASTRNTRYQIIDPYIRFWLNFAGPLLPEIERGRGELVAQRVINELPVFMGKSIELIIREALTRMLPNEKFRNAMYLGSYWTRDNRIEVDLVGGDKENKASEVDFIGSIKWRQRSPFNSRDVEHLMSAKSAIPGANENTLMVGVSRSGFTSTDLDIEIGPDEIVNAWQ